MTGLRYKYNPGQLLRLSPVRDRTANVPDTTDPYMRSPPLIPTTVDEVADVLGIDTSASGAAVGERQQVNAAPRAAQAARRAARDFMRWREEQLLAGS